MLMACLSKFAYVSFIIAIKGKLLDSKVIRITLTIVHTVKLQILAILANGIKRLILIPANIYNQSRGRTR